MTRIDLEDLTDEQLLAEWEQARNAYEAYYKAYRVASAVHDKLTGPPLKEYNAIRADEAKTAQWRLQCDASHAALLKLSSEGDPIAAKRNAYAAEWQRRGNQLHYPRIEALKRELNRGKS